MLWKKIRYYVYVAIIVILSVIYVYNLKNSSLQNVADKGTIETYIVKYGPYFVILLACGRYAGNIVTGTGKTIVGEYGKLTEEEKELYDISKVKKVKMAEILCALSLIIVTVLAFAFLELFPNVIAPQTFLVCYLVEIVMLIILSKTKWILNRFCRKSRMNH